MALLAVMPVHAHDEPQLTHEQAIELIHRSQVASPYRLSEKARAGRIRYTIALDKGVVWQWPETFEQHVARSGDGVSITICSSCGTEPAPDAQSLRQYLAPNRWIDSDSREVLAFARSHAVGISVKGKRVARQMHLLEKAVKAHMTGAIDFRRYDAASAALKSHNGDCTEFAVLLAAAARARGIPTRLAYGIAYASRFTGASHVFSPHVWVQAWDGQRWTSYDAGMGQFDSAHIALAIGDGRPANFRNVVRALAGLRIVDAVGIVTVSSNGAYGAAVPSPAPPQPRPRPRPQ